MQRGINVQSPNLTLAFLGLVMQFFVLPYGTTHAALLTEPSTACNACDGVATVTATLAGVVTYEWYTPDGDLVDVVINDTGSATVENLCHGVYRVQYTNGAENNTEWFSVGLVGGDAGELIVHEVCTGTGNTNLFNRLEGNPTPGGEWTAPTGTPHNGIFNPLTGTPGLHTYTVIVDGCVVSSGVFVVLIQNADPGLSTTYLICETYDPFFLTDVLAGTPDLGGQWFDGQQQPFDGIYDPAINDTQLFTYMISAPGCPNVFSTMFVIENQLPDAGEPTELSVCPNAVPFSMTDALNGTPQSGGTWLNAINQPVGNVFDPNVLGEGTYTYLVQGATPCPSREATLTITFTDGISAGNPTPVQVCSNAPAFNLADALTGEVTLNGSWTDPSLNAIDGVIVPSTAASGAYTYTVEAIGCQPVSATVDVLVEPLADAGPGGNLTVCETASPIVLNSLYGPSASTNGTWNIDGLPIEGSLVVEGSQVYDLTYLVEGSICPNVLSHYLVTVDPLPTAGVDQNVAYCAIEETIMLTEYVPLNSNFESSWFDPSMQEIDPLLAAEASNSGTYTYIVYADNACPDATATLALTIEEPPFEPGLNSASLCYGGGPINLFEVANGLPAGGNWSFDGQSIQAVLTSQTAISGLYTYTIESGAVCGAIQRQLMLELIEPLSAGVGTTMTICTTEMPFDASTFISGASPGGDWLVNGVSDNAIVFDPSSDGNTVFTYIVPAVGPCPSDSSTVEIIVDNGFAFSTGPDVVLCSGDDPVQVGTNMCPDCEYSWSPQTFLTNSDLATPTFHPPFAGETQVIALSVTVTNGVCSVEDDLLVTVHPAPTLFVNGPSVLCQFEEGQWSVSGADAFSWSIDGGAFLSDASVVTYSASTDFDLVVTGVNGFGCETAASWGVSVLEIPLVLADIPPVGGCSPLTIELAVPQPDEDGTSYFYTLNGVAHTESGEASLVQPGTYDLALTAVAENGCTATDVLDAHIEVYPTPVASFHFDRDALSIHQTTVQFENTTQAATLFSWDFAGLGTSALYSPAFTFPDVADQGYRVCLDVVNEFGCADDVCHDVFIPGELVVYVPTAFTPDNDGLNEVFKPVVSGYDRDGFRFMIINRWGEVIFETLEPEHGWLGEVNEGAHYAQNDSYVWVLEVRDAYSANMHRYTGHVTLIR